MGKIVMEGRKERVNHLPEYLLGRATGGGGHRLKSVCRYCGLTQRNGFDRRDVLESS